MNVGRAYVGETRSPCGWCGRYIVWAIEGEQHYKGVCVDPTLGLWERRTQQSRPQSVRPTSPPLQELPYITGRLAQVFDAPSKRRPRWTLQDAHAFRALLRAYNQSRLP